MRKKFYPRGLQINVSSRISAMEIGITFVFESNHSKVIVKPFRKQPILGIKLSLYVLCTYLLSPKVKVVGINRWDIKLKN